MPVTLTVGTNSYISVADAAAYFGDRLFTDDWGTATADQQAQALIMATRAIDRQVLKGRKVELDPTIQPLAFPRAYPPTLLPWLVGPNTFPGSVAPPLLPWTLNPNDFLLPFPGRYGWVEETSVSQRVLDACCEEALAILNRYNSPRRKLQLEGIQQYSTGRGGLGERFNPAGKGVTRGLISPEARELLAPVLGGVAQIR